MFSYNNNSHVVDCGDEANDDVECAHIDKAEKSKRDRPRLTANAVKRTGESDITSGCDYTSSKIYNVNDEVDTTAKGSTTRVKADGLVELISCGDHNDAVMSALCEL